VSFFPDVADLFHAWRFGDFTDRHRVGNLLATEPPVVVIRVALLVIEAQIRRGLALSHTPMLTPTCGAVANQTLSRQFYDSKCGNNCLD
jgi:hypothetical protein